MAAARLRLAGVSPTPGLDVEVLVAHVLGCSRTDLHTGPGRALSATAAQAIDHLVARRARGEPVAYLTGAREFWTLSLHLTPDVLIPRPETELLVELALARMPAGAGGRVLDLGTGSGALALALAAERPRWQVVATDIEPRALAVARANAARLELTNVAFHPGDWWQAVEGQHFDLVVCNPPYVADDDPHLCAGDVRFEPRMALRGGADGLDAIRQVIAGAPGHLVTNGALLLEHGYAQGAAVRVLCAAAGLQASTARDLAGHERATACVRPS